MNSQHYPVMYNEVSDLFEETGQKLFIDCTLGMGGHTRHILEAYPDSEVIALDVDEQSIDRAKDNLADLGQRVTFFKINFTNLFAEIDLNNKDVSGILVDPGISIFQLKESERGFSHSREARLDMRKDMRTTLTAHEIINTYSEKQLAEMFTSYGEIPKAPALAKKIIEKRLFGSIDTTTQLAELTAKFYNWRPKRGKTHPAANLFQALRIRVNGELEGIDGFIRQMPQYLPKGARIAFLTFHSVEDRIVKRTFTALQRENKISIIKPFPMFPGEKEVAENLPSRSAKLRAGEIL
jgi:16S rRNA (cytosine1402-N4)-methyltransferase